LGFRGAEGARQVARRRLEIRPGQKRIM